jgi:hypothetical protein
MSLAVQIGYRILEDPNQNNVTAAEPTVLQANGREPGSGQDVLNNPAANRQEPS